MANNFIHFSDVMLHDPMTWQGKKILSFDVDWASDEVLSYCLDTIQSANIPATFMMTHETPLLNRMCSMPNIELGIHPNFNPLIESTDSGKTAQGILEDLLALVPEAQVLRAHSLTHSGRWLGLYEKLGLKYTSNYCMLGVETIQPFLHVNSVIECPHYFADDAFLFRSSNGTPEEWDTRLQSNTFNGLRVFNFHPIHVALNSDSLERYESSRSNHRDWNTLQPYRHKGYGVERLLETLLSSARSGMNASPLSP